MTGVVVGMADLRDGRLMSGSGPILDRVVAELTEADCG